jgi:hypothetical protein
MSKPKTTPTTSLFPEGHGSYDLQPANDSAALAVVQTDCPLCDRSFENHFLLTSRLGLGRKDPDMRVRYSGIEPLHYAITTCPSCLFSAETEAFANTPKRYSEAIYKVLEPYKGTKIKIAKERDMDSVFASLYLALACAPAALERSHELACAGLWLKIMRLYEDVGDKKMYEFAFAKTYESYDYIYSNIRFDDRVLQQIAFLLGELNFKMERYDDARKLHHSIKVAKNAPPTLARAVDDRLEVIRKILNPDL